MNHSPHPLHSRRAVLTALGAGTLGLPVALCSAAEPVTSAATLQFNVRDFGARGDGKTDDTKAFESALAAAAQAPTGRCVRVPPGKYRLTRSLTLDSTLLIGLEAGGFPADTQPLPHLIVDVPAPQPCLIAKTGASVHGLELDFRRAKPDTVFGPGVKIEGGGVSLSNLLLQLEVEYTDGTRDVIVSDASWKLTTAGPIQANNEYDGEEYDARREMPGWAKAGFDGRHEIARGRRLAGFRARFRGGLEIGRSDSVIFPNNFSGHVSLLYPTDLGIKLEASSKTVTIKFPRHYMAAILEVKK